MNDLLNRLFGLEGLGFGTPDAALVFERPLPGWGWALLAVACVALGLWTYRRLPGGGVARALLACSRGLLIVLLALLAAGPQLRLDQIRVEPDRVFVLMDRSASLAVPDAPGGATRGEQADAALALAGPALDALRERSEVGVWRFGSEAREAAEPGEPGDPATRIGAALAAVLDEARGAPIGGIVLISDGRSTDRVPAGVLRRLESERVPVFAVPLGSADPVRSVAIDRAESPGVAFVRDAVPVRARVEWSGGAPADARVELFDRVTGAVIDTAPVEASDDEPGAWVTLTVTPEESGARDLGVRLVGVSEDIDDEDNTQRVALEVIDRPIRVLYLDGSPRWERHYVKNLLVRESSIDSTAMILASGRQYVQEGDTLIARLPVSPEEWDAFDVVILGDMSADLFGGEQLAQLAEHVAQRGAGVLWLAGPGATPGSWFESPAGVLLPLRPGSIGVWDEPVVARPTREADRLGVLRTGEDGKGWLDRLSDPSAGWTRLQWALRPKPEDLKPGVATLADAVGIDSDASAPLVLSMRYGAGRVALVGTDEIWRWRYGRGETVPERVWLPLIRMLARGRVESALGAGVLRVRPEQPRPGSPAVVELEVFDQGVIDRLPERVRAEVVRADGRRDSVELRGEGASRTGEWIPDAPGAFTVELRDGPAELATLGASARVVEPGDERADLNTDHGLLAALSERTGGRVVDPGETDRLAEWVPNRSRVHTGTPIIETLWDRWVVLIVVLTLASLEWVGRRLIRLA